MKKSILLVPILVFTMTSCGLNPAPISSSIESSLEESSELVESSELIESSEPIESSDISESSESSINLDDYWWSTYTNQVTILNNGVVFKNGLADPSVVRGDDGYFYCFGTGGMMLQSEDACIWNVYQNNVIPRPTWGDGYYSGKIPNIWAPDVVKVQDKWIYYYSLSAWDGPCGIGYAVADEISGPYEDKGRLFDSGEVGGDYSIGVNNSIDPQVFVDDDEKVYMVFGSFRGIYIIQLTDDGQACYQGASYQKQHKTLIAGQPTAWDGAQYEGSYIFKKDGYYYYMGSSGTCCAGANSTYNVRVGRSKNILGPYIDSEGHNLKLSSGTSTYGDIVVFSKASNRDVKGPGHNSILVDDAGNYWIYAHAFISTDNYATRHLMMDKLLWDENGMPYLEDKAFTFGEEMDGPLFLVE